ncbi:MAG: hypothetical protein PHQ14_05965 [Chromatiales bacterium]|jgi:hypothetical protein|nr:hypothetical protein [Chromatiales bacterium]MDX9767630.1 hypothetical protein [Ectothiorhodospiraceae bacterium]
MDLLDFDGGELYFEEPISGEVQALLDQASRAYGDGGAECPLLRAYLLAPERLTVLVALYRFYFYQHRLDDALLVADRTIMLAARRLGLPADWSELDPLHLGRGAMQSLGLVRFLLLALKAAGYINLRLGRHELGVAMLRQVHALDSADRLGAGALLEVVGATIGQPIVANA